MQFPHHECEVAQSEALTGKPFARYWMHNGFINIRDEKMSKSLSNGVNVNELLARYRREVLRFFILSTHYRNPLNFSDEAMEQATSAVERIENCIVNLRHRLSGVADSDDVRDGGTESAFISRIHAIERTFAEKMGDDFNTPDAVSAVFEWVSVTNGLLQQERVDKSDLVAAWSWIERVNGVLGIAKLEEQELLDEEVDRLIEERVAARLAKNWARADEIRNLLSERGIILEDTPQGIRWRRK